MCSSDLGPLGALASALTVLAVLGESGWRGNGSWAHLLVIIFAESSWAVDRKTSCRERV